MTDNTPRPARGYSWPPFAPGNTAGVRHGAFSPRLYAPVAAEVAEALLEARPDLAGFTHAVAAWAEAEERARRLRAWLGEHGEFDDDRKLREGPMRHLVRFEKLARELRQDLGLTPRSYVELLRSRAETIRSGFDLAAALQAGSDAFSRREDQT